MAENFAVLWSMAFSWIGSIFTMHLPIYFGGVALSLLDIIIGTIAILVSFAAIRALLKSGFTIAGKDISQEYNHQKNISRLNSQTHSEYNSRMSGMSYIDKLEKEGKLK